MNNDAICGNCLKKYSAHYHETHKGKSYHYCTPAQCAIFTNTPNDTTMLDMIIADTPSMYEVYLHKWRKENGHE